MTTSAVAFTGMSDANAEAYPGLYGITRLPAWGIVANTRTGGKSLATLNRTRSHVPCVVTSHPLCDSSTQENRDGP